MDLSSIFGIALGIGGIFLGHIIESGHAGSLIQATAAFIVFGGTLGATVASHRGEDLRRAMSLFFLAFRRDDEQRRHKIAREIVDCAKVARKESILAVEAKLKTFTSDYMKMVFRFVVDGVESERIKEVFVSDVDIDEERKMAAAKVWADAGGFAPTIGIIGAVLGLIHVMSNLTNTAELGKGIAVAFVSTIYGVGSANLIFLPIANKIRRKIKVESEERLMIVEGAISVLNGLNPYVIREKMQSYISSEERPRKDAKT